MIKCRSRKLEVYINRRNYSLQTVDKKKFQHTVFLPKTNFPMVLKSKELIERDERIQREKGFLEYYSWQRENLKGKEFVLHDGPPYANGKPHIGHAINKILKDIILRGQLIQGNRVHYIPGWDCHGLPIEMISLKEKKGNNTPIQIRQKSRELARSMSEVQKEAFKQWGVLGDWNNNCYYTYDTSYVSNELKIFWKLFEKGLLIFDLKPVYWSPSSRTALAEAELVYKNKTCQALTVKLEVIQNFFEEPLYLLVWTTTPWTLPLNKAVFCSTSFKYSFVKIESQPGLYIIASDLVKSFQQKFMGEITEKGVITSEELTKFKYRHPWFKEKVMDVFKSTTLKLCGTGLLHSVPGHGHEDYLLGLENGLKVESFVDEQGCFVAEMGSDLSGKNVLEDGSEYVIHRLSSDIILNENYTHSYPFDWRTDKPIIIRASKQWFIDCGALKQKAVESLKKVEVPVNYFESKLKNRPFWCLSRQRTWGVPIPAFYHKKSGRPLLSKGLVQHLCNLVETAGSDVWWTESLETLFPKKFCEEFFVHFDDVVKGEDIMDIWFDSGVSWDHVLNGQKSDLYLEGVDQYSGWFQSSLLISIAVKNDAPFKKIMTHGFAVDKDGKKMSKSLGNVVDPEDIIKGNKPLGVDTLRWWVGSHSHQEVVPASEHVLKSSSDNVQKLRLIFRFLLGALNDTSPSDLEKDIVLGTLDRYLLNSCYKFYNSALVLYNSYNIQKLCSSALFFAVNDVSSLYIFSIKDRLYCDHHESQRRKACLYTVNGIFNTLCYTLAPVLPHLVEEALSYYPVSQGEKILFYEKEKWMPPTSWKDDTMDQRIHFLNDIKQALLKEKNLMKMICKIETNEENYEMLKKMQNGEEKSSDSELTEILKVAQVHLEIGDKNVSASQVDSWPCLRCRRYTALENHELCSRCEKVLVYALKIPAAVLVGETSGMSTKQPNKECV